jgi:regulator of sigma E protease
LPQLLLVVGEPVEIRFERAGAALATVATPATKVERDRFGNVYRRGMLGVTASGAPVMRPLAPIEVPGAALRFTRSMLTLMTDSLWQVVSGRRPVSELAGPLKMAQVSGQQATLGFIPFLFFAALISINLGFINLLPIPMLDGGHLLFYLIEAVRRRPLRPQAQEWAFRTGLAALLILMVFVTFNDLASFGLWKKLGGLIG